MTKNTTKRAFMLSLLSLLMCCTMLLGTTFAWFTDSVTSANNIIKAGNLDVTMEWADGTEDPETANWQDASSVAIFNYDRWEPGYTEAKHIKVSNVGTLALKWTVAIAPNGAVSELADVIDVYMYKSATMKAKQVTDRALSGFSYVGSLTEFMRTEIAGDDLLAGEVDYITFVLKMREDAGNYYQKMELVDFSVKLFATQMDSETDSFGKDYDKYASKTVVTPETAQGAIWAAEEGATIYLADGHYGDLVIENADHTPKKGITIECSKAGNGTAFSVSSINLNSSEDVVIKNIFFDVKKGAEIYKQNGSASATDGNNFKAGIIGAVGGAATGAKNVVIDGCIFDGTGASKYYIAICFEEQGRPTSRATDITVMNCSVNNSIFNFIRANYLSEGTVFVKNNTVWEETYHSALNFTGNAANLVVKNNTFGTSMMSDRYIMSNGWNPDKAMLGTSRQGSNHITIEVTGNKFIQSLNSEGHVIDLKSSYTTANTTLVFNNNTYVGMTEADVPCIWH